MVDGIGLRENYTRFLYTDLASRMATIQPEHSDSEVARNSYCRRFSRR